MFWCLIFSRGSVWLLRKCGTVGEIIDTQHNCFDSYLFGTFRGGGRKGENSAEFLHGSVWLLRKGWKV